jgi:hypothetical protein
MINQLIRVIELCGDNWGPETHRNREATPKVGRMQRRRSRVIGEGRRKGKWGFHGSDEQVESVAFYYISPSFFCRICSCDVGLFSQS